MWQLPRYLHSFRKGFVTGSHGNKPSGYVSSCQKAHYPRELGKAWLVVSSLHGMHGLEAFTQRPALGPCNGLLRSYASCPKNLNSIHEPRICVKAGHIPDIPTFSGANSDQLCPLWKGGCRPSPAAVQVLILLTNASCQAQTYPR